MPDQDSTQAGLTQGILGEDIEYNEKIPYSCPRCGEEYELEEQAVFEYVLRSEYGLRPERLDELLKQEGKILKSLGEDQTIDDLLEQG